MPGGEKHDLPGASEQVYEVNMNNNLPKPLKDVMRWARHTLPDDCVITRGSLWVEPPGVLCPGFRVDGPNGRFAALAINGDQAYMEFQIDDTCTRDVFGKKLHDGFVDSTTLLLWRLFVNGAAPS